MFDFNSDDNKPKKKHLLNFSKINFSDPSYYIKVTDLIDYLNTLKEEHPGFQDLERMTIEGIHTSIKDAHDKLLGQEIIERIEQDNLKDGTTKPKIISISNPLSSDWFGDYAKHFALDGHDHLTMYYHSSDEICDIEDLFKETRNKEDMVNLRMAQEKEKSKWIPSNSDPIQDIQNFRKKLEDWPQVPPSTEDLKEAEKLQEEQSKYFMSLDQALPNSKEDLLIMYVYDKDGNWVSYTDISKEEPKKEKED